MTLDAVRALRHSLALDRIADERARRGRKDKRPSRVPQSTSLVIRQDVEGVAGSPATITRLKTSIVEDNYYNIDAVRRIGVFIEKIVHDSGPVLVQPAFGPEDLSRDGSIVIKTLGAQDEPLTDAPDPNTEPETYTGTTGGAGS